MKNRIEIITANIEASTLFLIAAPYKQDEQELKPKGQMLVDSDQLSFIYILENKEDFVYVGIPHEWWPLFREAQEIGVEVKLNVNNKEIELVDIFNELDYLVENIKDNANYGEDMEQKVIEHFGLEK
ncbi:UPF0738 family protein [Metabacillus arenae]|uniref:UPF0738 protein IC621_22990 n=1 Tax=Metabacillus arenae TaxID=2771434 RepID=A0A926RYL4_9BACI|nr:hypothetical protein [Metabacillus arenae]MBD1383073.1 hypothetical protein [Metabacillus arenae]